MKKILLALTIVLALTACSKRKYKGIVINDNIPTYFYGFNLGDDTEEAKEELDDSEFRILQHMSNGSFIHFEPKLSEKFNYQGTKWQMLDLNAANGKVWGINFVNSFNTEKEAAKNYQQVKEWAKTKYNAFKETPQEILFMGEDK